MAAHRKPPLDGCDHSDVPGRTPLGARMFADFCFALSLGWGIWWLLLTVPDRLDSLTAERIGDALGPVGFVLMAVLLINVGAVWVVQQATPQGGWTYFPWRRWLGWLWTRRTRTFAAEWAEVGPYLGTEHATYLRSHQWQQRRQLLVRQAQYRCQSCTSQKHLQVHHLTLDRLFNERPEDLVVLCRPCHQGTHGAWLTGGGQP